MLKTTVVLFTVLAATLAGPLDREEPVGSPQGCYLDGIGFVPIGSVTPSNKGCYEYRCTGNNSTVSLGCGAMTALPPWKIVEDKEKPWPGCCPYAVKMDE